MSELTVADVLDRAADLIEPEGAWIKNWYCLDQFGAELPEASPHAVCWCARGAVYQIEPQAGEHIFAPLLQVIDGVYISDIESWNDAPERTQAEVVAALRQAATLSRASAA